MAAEPKSRKSMFGSGKSCTYPLQAVNLTPSEGFRGSQRQGYSDVNLKPTSQENSEIYITPLNTNALRTPFTDRQTHATSTNIRHYYSLHSFSNYAGSRADPLKIDALLPSYGPQFYTTSSCLYPQCGDSPSHCQLYSPLSSSHVNFYR